MSDAQQKEAMLSWLSKVTQEEITELKALVNPKYLLKAIQPIIDTNKINDSHLEGWKDNYLKFKSMVKLLQNYVIKVLKQSFADRMQAFNIVEMSQGIDDEGLYTLLKLVFFVCINSPKRQNFISAILQLSQVHQQLFMTIIQQNLINTQQQSVIEGPPKEKLDELYLTLQNLSMQNESLQQKMKTDTEMQIKFQETNKKLQQENLRLHKQLMEKSQQLYIKQQQANYQSFTTDSSQSDEILKQMRKTMQEQEQQNYKQNYRLRQNIQILNEELERVRQQLKITEQRQFSRNNDKMDHANCINIKQHQKIISEQNKKLKELTQNQWKDKLQKIRLTNLLQQLKNKYQTVMQQKNKKQQQYMLTGTDAQQLRIQFFIRIKQTLKKKLQHIVQKGTQVEQKVNDIEQNNNKLQNKTNNIIQNDEYQQEKALQQCSQNLKSSRY